MRTAVFISAALLVAAGVYAQPSVKAEIHPRTVRAGESFSIALGITGDRVQRISMPEVEGLQIAASPYSQSTSMTIAGQSAVTTIQLAYQAVAATPGPYTLPPIEVVIDGATYATDPIGFEVMEASASPQSQRPGTLRPTPQAQRGGELTVEDLVFLRADVNKREVYQGEPIILTLEYWELEDSRLAVNAHVDMAYQQVSTTGFYVVNLDAKRTRETHLGRNYIVQRFTRGLFPTGTGQMTIGSWAFKGQATLMFSGFSRHFYDLATDPIHITVNPLPPRAEHFTGGVGTFTLSAMLTQNEVTVGETTNLVISVTGVGNPEAIGAPALPAIPRVNISGPDVTINTMSSQGPLACSKSFSYAITPNAAGAVEIPPIPFAHFDPEQETYVASTTRPFTLAVRAAPEGMHRIVVDVPGEGIDQRRGVDVLSQDLRPLITDPGPIRAAPAAPWWFYVGFSAPPLCYAGLAALVARRRHFANNTTMARRHFAHARGRKRLAEALHAADPAQALSRALTGFVADKFGVTESGMTSHDAERLLNDAGIERDLVASIVKTLRACERARYASTHLSEQELSALMDASEVNMDRLETFLKKGGMAS